MADPSGSTRRPTLLVRRATSSDHSKAPQLALVDRPRRHRRRLPGMPAYEQEHAVRQLLPRTSGDASFAVDALRSKAGVPDVVTELQFDDAVLTREVRML